MSDKGVRVQKVIINTTHPPVVRVCDEAKRMQRIIDDLNNEVINRRMDTKTSFGILNEVNESIELFNQSLLNIRRKVRSSARKRKRPGSKKKKAVKTADKFKPGSANAKNAPLEEPIPMKEGKKQVTIKRANAVNS